MKSPEWHSYHLFYHGSLDRVVTDFVLPVLTDLFQEDSIDHFFFIRYVLGGPHIRLRLRIRPDSTHTVPATLAAAAEIFFQRFPSASQLSDEFIQSVNRTVLATDPAESDNKIYPNHTLREFHFRPETERYGGPELLRHSLDFFAFSSLEALRFVGSMAKAPRGRQLMAIFRLLARQALGLSWTAGELFALLEYPMATWGGPLRRAAERGDEVFDRQREGLRSLLREEAEAFLRAPESVGFEPARRLSWEICTASERTRRGIGTSQMHMTGNRLGLSNSEEVYLSRLLTLAAHDLADSEPGFWSDLQHGLAARSKPACGLKDLLPTFLQEVFPKQVAAPAPDGPGREYDWVHFVARHSPAGGRWADNYRSQCGAVFQQIRHSLALLRKRRIIEGREALESAKAARHSLGDLSASFSHVMDRWHYGALAYYLYCISDFDGATEAIRQAQAAVEAAIGEEAVLLPLAQTCHEFLLHQARIEYLKGRWNEAYRQIELASQALRGLRPLCTLPSGEKIYFSSVAEYFQRIPDLNDGEREHLRNALDLEAFLHHFEHVALSICVTPVIPYP